MAGEDVGMFVGSFLDSFGNAIATRKRQAAEKEHQQLTGRLGMLKTLAGMPDIQADPKQFGQVLSWMDETLTGRGWQDKPKKASSGGGGGQNGKATPLQLLAHVLAPMQALAHPKGIEAMTARQLKPLDLGGAAVESTQSDPVTGQKLPGAPGYGILGTLKTPEQQQQSQFALDEQARGQQKKVEDEKRNETIARLRAAHSKGDIGDFQYQQAMADVQSGLKLSNPPATGLKPVRAYAKINGPDNKPKWIPVTETPNEDGSSTYVSRLNGQQFKPEDILDVQTSTRGNSLAQSRHYMELAQAYKGLHPEANDADVDRAVGEAIEQEEINRLQGGQLQNAGRVQNMNIHAGESGVGANTSTSVPASWRPGAKPAAAKPMPSIAPSTAPSTAPVGALTTSTATRTAATPTAAKVTGSKPATTNAAAAPKVTRNPVAVEDAMKKDPDMAQAKAWFANGAKDTGFRGPSGMRLRNGIEKLKSITGLSQEELTEEGQRRAAVNKSVNQSIARLEVYGELNRQIELVGNAFLDARRKFGNDPKKWREVKNAVISGYAPEGNEDLARLVTAANEFQRVYARFSSGAGQSTAQPHVSAAEAINQMVSPSSNVADIQGVLKGVRSGADADLKAYKETIQAGQKQLRKDWGKFDATDITPPMGNDQGDPKVVVKTAADFFAKHDK